MALPLGQKLVIFEATLCLLLARLIIAIPFTYWARYLGQSQVETPVTEDSPHFDRASQIQWAIYLVSPSVPWRADCLPQAVAASLMLRRRRIPATVYLGIAKSQPVSDEALEAHAWVRSGNVIVTGGMYQRFKVISSFARDYP